MACSAPRAVPRPIQNGPFVSDSPQLDQRQHDQISVSFVLPVLNERRHLRAAVESALGQQGLAAREVILVVGRNTDGTDQIVAELDAEYPEVVVVRNPRNAISRAMNLGTAAARHPVIIRVDAHSVLPDDYAVRAVSTLRRVGAVNLGGRMLASGTTRFERAVAWAYNSAVGLGGAVYHVGSEPGPAESAYLGVFDKNALVEIGGFDESINRGEDWELNYRFRQRDQLVWYEPDLEVLYRPRSNLPALAKQFYASGRWRGELIRRLGTWRPLRYFAPPLLVLGLLLSLVTLAAGLPLAVSLHPAWWIAVGAAFVVPGVYGGWLLVVTAFAREETGAVKRRMLIVLPVMHVCWGWGCLLGLIVRQRGAGGLHGR
ncbi:MAG: glycosyltransferase family 2 protein [Microbacterium sp.]|nr:glycosyltransferase family 2 protein [Microbacterium sp.]